MPQPEVTVVIPHHVGDLILRCLDSVRLSRGVSFQTVVVTSNATLQERIPDWVTLYYDTGGPAHKRNLAVARSRSPFTVFLDDDVEVSPYCVYELVSWLKDHPRCGMAFAKIYKMEEGRRDEFDAAGSWLTWTGFLWDRAGNSQRDTSHYDKPQAILSSKSATCVVRRAAFKQVGGFDASYYILGEETDLAWRCWLKGWEVWYVPTAVSWHAFGCESLKPKADYYTIRRTMTYGCRNYVSMLLTNVGRGRLTLILPCHLFAWLLAAIGFALRGDYQRGLGILRGLSEVLQTLPHVLRKRRAVQRLRVVSDRVLWPIISHSPGLMYYLHRMWRYWTTQLHG
mgnify:FL=1